MGEEGFYLVGEEESSEGKIDEKSLLVKVANAVKKAGLMK